EPPSKYYKDGFNLYKRLRKYRANHLLFLHDWRVPWTNNMSERALRKFKRKQKQVMVFRSFESLDYLCQCMGVIETMRMRDENLFEGIAEIFDRPPPSKDTDVA
ncbi:MAG: transposase, partial [Oscillospiraceae bacterium]|nr:transposase [Oscillospiraceae bacterium]